MTEPEAEGEPAAKNDLLAAALGLVALGLACVPPALFVLAPDDGPRGAWIFADARSWTGLRWFCLASTLELGPVLGLVRLAGLRARRWPARVPGGLAMALSLAMIPGTVMQIAWWMAG